MKTIFLKLFAFFSVIIIFSQCTEKIDLKLGSTYARLIVDGSISTDTMAHQVRLTKSADYFSGEVSPAVRNAIVKISDGTNTFVLTEKTDKPGTYQTASNVYGVIGRTYTLTVDNVDINDDNEKEHYESSSTINPVNPVDSIKLWYFPMGPDTAFAVMVFAYDPPTKEFYAFKADLNSKPLTDTITDVWIQDDISFNGNYTNGVWSQFIYTTHPLKYRVNPGDTVTFELNSIPEDYYKFILELQSGVFYDPLFSGPPANIRSNISNGALGYFVAYSKSRAKTLIPPKPWLLEIPY